MDMEGNTLHVWHHKFRDAWPQRDPPTAGHDWKTWRYAHPLEDGGLLAIFEGLGIIRLDRDSNLLWAMDEPIHHDIDVLPNGDIYTLTREARIIPRLDPDELVLEDFILVLGADGRVKDRFSILEAWEASDLDAEVAARLEAGGDLFHANTLEYFDGSRSHLSPLYKRGNILTSFRKLDTLAIVDSVARKLVWTMSGDWAGQHYPTLLDDGRILLFVNNTSGRASSVQILDPVKQSPDWIYRATPPTSLFTRCCGLAQMLANGNVLITESQDGRAFEVTPEGEIVWEFINPFRLSRGEVIAYLYVLTRYPQDLFSDWLP